MYKSINFWSVVDWITAVGGRESCLKDLVLQKPRARDSSLPFVIYKHSRVSIAQRTVPSHLSSDLNLNTGQAPRLSHRPRWKWILRIHHNVTRVRNQNTLIILTSRHSSITTPTVQCTCTWPPGRGHANIYWIQRKRKWHSWRQCGWHYVSR